MMLARLLAAAGVLCAITGPAPGDWIPDDGHKMHFPQLPDPTGWDVEVSRHSSVNTVIGLADDFKCSKTGEIRDIHFWGSWQNDEFPASSPTQGIANIHVEIRADLPADDPNNPQDYSMPVGGLDAPYLEPLWKYDTSTNFTIAEVRPPSSQGWMKPGYYFHGYTPNDHQRYFQYNIVIPDDVDAFEQQEGTIYWLVVQVETESPDIHFGWKTADLSAYPDRYQGSHYQDDAVAWDGIYKDMWIELTDQDGASMDLAFVITPEPASLAVVVLGGVVLVVRRRRRYHGGRARG